MTTVDYAYPDFDLHLICGLCRAESSDHRLTAHSEVRWLHSPETYSLKWLPSNRTILNLLNDLAWPTS